MNQDIVVIIVIVAIRIRFKKRVVNLYVVWLFARFSSKYLICIQHLFWGTERLRNLPKVRQCLSCVWSRFKHRQFGSRAYALKQYAILITCEVVEPAKNKEEFESIMWGEISELQFLISLKLGWKHLSIQVGMTNRKLEIFYHSVYGPFEINFCVLSEVRIKNLFFFHMAEQLFQYLLKKLFFHHYIPFASLLKIISTYICEWTFYSIYP